MLRRRRAYWTTIHPDQNVISEESAAASDVRSMSPVSPASQAPAPIDMARPPLMTNPRRNPTELRKPSDRSSQSADHAAIQCRVPMLKGKAASASIPRTGPSGCRKLQTSIAVQTKAASPKQRDRRPYAFSQRIMDPVVVLPVVMSAPHGSIVRQSIRRRNKN